MPKAQPLAVLFDTVIGTANPDYFEIATDPVEVWTYAGNDTVLTGDNDHLVGGVGSDTIKSGNGSDTILGGDRDDVIGDTGQSSSTNCSSEDIPTASAPSRPANKNCRGGQQSVFDYRRRSGGQTRFNSAEFHSLPCRADMPLTAPHIRH